MKLGIIDWGIGGLDAWRRIRAALPGVATVYLSDAGFTPYGKVPAERLHARLTTIAERLPVDTLVIACNAASTVLDVPLPLPSLGVIAPGIRMALSSGLDTVGVLGGDRTIASGLHARALEAAGRRVIAVASQPLSAHVEAGRLDGPELLADLAPRCAELADAQATLLACTHYPALLPVLVRLLPAMRWLDPVDGLVADVVAAVRGAGREYLDEATRVPDRVLTTGDPEAMRRAASLAFGVQLEAVERTVF